MSLLRCSNPQIASALHDAVRLLVDIGTLPVVGAIFSDARSVAVLSAAAGGFLSVDPLLGA